MNNLPSFEYNNLAFYNAEAAAYASAPHKARRVADFIAELPRGAHVLEFGDRARRR